METPDSTGFRLLSRRTALSAAGAVTLGVAGVTSIVEAVSTAGSATTAAAPGRMYACALTPEVTEGPYYLPLDIVRKNLTEGRPGVPMALRARVVDAASCNPIQGAVLDIWHCDALGVYSGYPSPGAAGPGRGHESPADGETFLRGVQMTDERGYAEFSSIFPGWYAGRAVHVHAKVHIGRYIESGLAGGGHVAHTGQLFVAEDLTRSVAPLAPYRRNHTARTTNAQDRHYDAGGAAGMLTVVPRDRYHLTHGLLATVTVAVDPDATPKPV
jgi:protocatechuate 3,4-dioxygenase beta subunit